MHLTDFAASKPGRLVQPSLDYWAFVPAPLAPRLTLSVDLINRLGRADRALGRLAGVTDTIRGVKHLLGPLLRREAAYSIRLDGLDCSLAGFALTDETSPGELGTAERALLNRTQAHCAALALGRAPDADRRFLIGLHRRLFADLPGIVDAGQFRDRQSWFGPKGCSRSDAVFVPPPVDEMHQALASLERYSQHPSELPHLLRLALMHYQFEVIHPFLTGTGAVNRLLLSLALSAEPGFPQLPIAISAYLWAHRDEYRSRLQLVSRTGEWEPWLRFFLTAVEEQADDCGVRVAALLALHEEYVTRLRRARERQPLYHIVDTLFERPAITVTGAAGRFGITPAAMLECLTTLVDLDILACPASEGSTVFVATDLLEVLEGARPAAVPTAALLRAARPLLLERRAIERPRAPGLGNGRGMGSGADDAPHLLDEATRQIVLELLREIEEAAQRARMRLSLVA